MITISKEIMYQNLLERIGTAFSLPEVCGIEIKGIYIEKGMDKESICHLAERAVSCSFHDILSDIDLSVMIRKSPRDIVSEEEYVKRIDRFGFTEERCLGICYMHDSKIYRIIMKNGMRYDFGFRFVMDETAAPVELQKPACQTVYKAEENANWPRENINRFWFVQIQALAKLYRKDYLISDHLANMNLNETLVQQMVLRDLKYGTNFHRYGYAEVLEYKKVGSQDYPYKKDDDSFNLIASKLYSAAVTYDRLTKVFYPMETERLHLFLSIWDFYDNNASCSEQ